MTRSRELGIAFGTGTPGPLDAITDVAGVRYHAAIEAIEAAIVNALLAAETMTGRRGVTAHGLEPDRLLEAMGRFGAPS